MNHLPSIIPRQNLRHHWTYLNHMSQPIGIVARYDEEDNKKRFHQFMLNENMEWTEGTSTPLPLFGIQTIPREAVETPVYIFEGEKCTQAAHHLGLPAVTSMMGSGQAVYADWAILAIYRHIKTFILVPDNDAAGRKYVEAVRNEIKKACPASSIFICELPNQHKGDDFVDWLKLRAYCQPNWDGFSPIDEPYSDYLRSDFEKLINVEKTSVEEYFSVNANSSPSFDKEPTPLDESLSEVKPCPIDTLPTTISSWLQNQADQMQIPVDFFAAPFLVYTATLIGRKRGLELRQNSGWIEFPNLWGMLIGRPSVMKTPAMEFCIGPLNKLALRALKDYEERLRSYKLLHDEWELKSKAIGEVNKQNFKKSLTDDSKSHFKISIEDPPVIPLQKRYKTDDSTIEKLGEILIENPQGILLYRDELSGWLNSFEKSGRENDRQFFLESWSGKKDFNVDRIKRGSLYIPSLFLSIFGSIQPGPLSQYVRSTINGGRGDDGFLQRFQIMIWPDVNPDWNLVKGAEVQQIKDEIDRIHDFLDRMSFDSEENPVILKFSAEAQLVFDKWQQKLELRLRQGDLPSHLEAHFAKYKKLLPALCLIHEHLFAAILGSYPNEISKRAIEASILWVEYLETHALRVYGSGKNAVTKAANELLKRIRLREIDEPFSIRDIYHSHHWSGLTNAEQVEEVIELLEEKGYLAGQKVKTNGRGTQRYWAHPKVYET